MRPVNTVLVLPLTTPITVTFYLLLFTYSASIHNRMLLVTKLILSELILCDYLHKTFIKLGLIDQIQIQIFIYTYSFTLVYMTILMQSRSEVRTAMREA